MKKLFIFCCFLYLFCTPISIHAANVSSISHTVETLIAPLGDSTSKTVYKTITYATIVVPPASIAWTEEIDGITYSGTLYLSTYFNSNNKTTATYTGTLYVQ